MRLVEHKQIINKQCVTHKERLSCCPFHRFELYSQKSSLFSYPHFENVHKFDEKNALNVKRKLHWGIPFSRADMFSKVDISLISSTTLVRTVFQNSTPFKSDIRAQKTKQNFTHQDLRHRWISQYFVQRLIHLQNPMIGRRENWHWQTK